MNAPVRVALLSFWHVHAKDYAREALAHPETELALIWDEDPVRGQAEAAARGIPFVADLEAIWSDPSIDAIVLTSATSEHHRLLTRAAKAGKHIYTEKVVAPTVREAKEVLETVRQAGVKMLVSLPRLYTGYTRAIRQIVASGQLGQLTQVRARVSHEGSLRTEANPNGWLPERFYNAHEAGGGVLIDFGVHPMYLTRLFLGMPDTVNSVFGQVTGRGVEDNAAVLLSYSNGAVGLVEAGFVNPHRYFALEVHGTKGLLHYGSPTDQLLLSNPDGWKPLEVPPDGPTPFEHWVNQLLRESDETRSIARENLQIALDLTALMEAANQSGHLGRAVGVNAG